MFFALLAKVSSRCSGYLPAAILEDQGGPPPKWRLNARFYNVVRNIATNISAFGQLKLGELSSLLLSIIPQFLYFIHCMVFDIILLRDNVHTIFIGDR